MRPLIRITIGLLLTALTSAPCVVCARVEPGDKFTIPLTKAYVAVFNDLNGSNFTIHCTSGHRDLGSHEIPPKEKYKWGFRVNFFETTHFVCGIGWRGGHGVFDIFKAKRDQPRCEHYCEWHVTEGGVYGYKFNNKTSPDLQFPWRK